MNFLSDFFSIKYTLSIQIMVLLTGLTMTSAQPLDGIEGKWKDPISGGIILVYAENGLYVGQLIGADDTELNKKIQEQEKVLILENFKKEGSTEYCCGTLYLPKRNKKLGATLILEDQHRLKIRWKFGFIKGNHYWSRY